MVILGQFIENLFFFKFFIFYLFIYLFISFLTMSDQWDVGLANKSLGRYVKHVNVINNHTLYFVNTLSFWSYFKNKLANLTPPPTRLLLFFFSQ